MQQFDAILQYCKLWLIQMSMLLEDPLFLSFFNSQCGLWVFVDLKCCPFLVLLTEVPHLV